MGNRILKMNNDNNKSYEYKGNIYDKISNRQITGFNGELENFNDIMNITINNEKNYILIKAQIIYNNDKIWKIKSIDPKPINNIMFPQEMEIQLKRKELSLIGLSENYKFILEAKQKEDIKVIQISNIYKYQMILKNSCNSEISFVVNSLIGLKNLGNTCYINSSLQILLHIPEFTLLMVKNKDYDNCHIYYINKIINLLINSYKNSFQYYIDPSDFVRFFKRNHKRFEGCTQRDTQMFLDELLWEINSELSLSHDQRPIEKNFYLPEQKGYYEYLKKSDKNSNYIMNDLFYVCFIHEKKCKNCDKKIFYFDETPGLKLNFNNIKGNNINLLELIKDNYMSLKYVNSSIPCERCKQYLFELKTRIARLPKILIIVLQKTNANETKKIPCVVNYEKNLDLNDFVKKTLIYKKGETQYSLYAINDHYGLTPFFGHYCSYIYLEKFKTWFSFDDTAVTTSTIPEPNLYNYVLFFKRI